MLPGLTDVSLKHNPTHPLQDGFCSPSRRPPPSTHRTSPCPFYHTKLQHSSPCRRSASPAPRPRRERRSTAATASASYSWAVVIQPPQIRRNPLRNLSCCSSRHEGGRGSSTSNPISSCIRSADSCRLFPRVGARRTDEVPEISHPALLALFGNSC